jgi:hypothetical protein
MSTNGWQFVENKFHYSRLVKDMETLYWNQLATAGLKKRSFATA